MKKTHIIGIIIIALAIGAILSTVADSSTYASFELAENNPGEEFHVVGQLNKEKEMLYDPQVDVNLFTFYLIDNEGKELKVNFKGTKPQDFERSEQIVLTGKYEEGNFIANKILMKCPSKYNEGANSEFTEVKANS
ncbi:MAG: cytochrome c maturation protein CcmE [Bacteroidetes bacterium]|nr:cytochrome c maturation protein CcmE [Bacteroidota bacterium]HET6245042.1 cytochrome c maturation protein CcmE [Bacteroidia bacterium]